MRSRLWAALYAALLALCGGCGTVTVPPPEPPAPFTPPTPVAPPVNPPVTPTTGAITDAQFAAVAAGTSDVDVAAALGAPFSKHDAAGFTIWTYVVSGTSRSAFVWLKAGVVDHKSTN